MCKSQATMLHQLMIIIRKITQMVIKYVCRSSKAPYNTHINQF